MCYGKENYSRWLSKMLPCLEFLGWVYFIQLCHFISISCSCAACSFSWNKATNVIATLALENAEITSLKKS